MKPGRVKETKLYIRVTPELDKRFTDWAKRLGLTKSQFGNICIQAGFSAVIRAISPEEAFTPAQLVDILKAAEDRGMDVNKLRDKMPGGVK